MLNKIKVVIFILLFSGQLFTLWSQTQERVTVKSLIGKVQVRSPKSGQWKPARIGMSVRMKWDIRTFVESSVELRFENGTILKIDENSVVGLSTLLHDKVKKISKSNVKIATGKVWGNVKKLVNKNSSFKFETPTAVAAIRGTVLGIDVANGKTTVDVVEGKVVVKNKESNKTVIIEAGKRAVVKKGQDNVETMNTGVTDPFVQETMVLDTIKKDTAVADTTLSDTLNIDTTVIADSLKQEALGSDSIITEVGLDTSEVSADFGLSIDDSITEEAEVSITTPADGDTSDVSSVTITGTVNDDAKVSVNGVEASVNGGRYSVTINLLPGENIIEAIASLGISQAVDKIAVVFDPPKDLFLSVVMPEKTQKTEITVTGVTTPGAEVLIDGNAVSVSFDGVFNYKLLIPDEEGDYTFEIIARYKGKEKIDVKSILYKPLYKAAKLTVMEPVLKGGVILILGSASANSTIEINNFVTKAGSDGKFGYEIPVSEKDLGEYIIDVIAIDELTGEEQNDSKNLFINSDNPAVNTSYPKVDIKVVGNATNNSSVRIISTDLTPEDELLLNINDGDVEVEVEPGEIYDHSLLEGKNKIKAFVTDKAGNKSVVRTKEIYYLPGPLSIDINEPDETLFDIDDLPPMPKSANVLKMNVEVEIDDGIGSSDCASQILYVKLNGKLLQNKGNYKYSGNISVHRGENKFDITTEDTAGNKGVKQFTVNILE